MSLQDVYHTSIFGIHAYQSWVDLYVWEHFLEKYGRLRAIIELGTFKGGMSIFLLLQAIQRGMKFWTFDNQVRPGMFGGAAGLVFLRDHFIKEDVLQGKSPRLSELLLDDHNHPLMLYCDNGNKPVEFNKYVPVLRDGDYVAAHDWGAEIAVDEIMHVCHLLERVLWGDCEALRSRTRFWRRIA